MAFLLAYSVHAVKHPMGPASGLARQTSSDQYSAIAVKAPAMLHKRDLCFHGEGLIVPPDLLLSQNDINAFAGPIGLHHSAIAIAAGSQGRRIRLFLIRCIRKAVKLGTVLGDCCKGRISF